MSTPSPDRDSTSRTDELIDMPPAPDLIRLALVESIESVVVKVGTNLIAPRVGEIDAAFVERLADQIAELKRRGVRVTLVSSGAIGSGLERLRLAERPRYLPGLQAAAAVGQLSLMRRYEEAFQRRGLLAAQLLVTADDFGDRERYLNMRNTVRQLFDWNATPVVNENDTVAVEEIRFGDNDRLAALMAGLVGAEAVVILSVVDGLLKRPPGESGSGDSAANPPIDIIPRLDEEFFALAGLSSSSLGTGGMRSKLAAARAASEIGAAVMIANGREPNVLTRLLAGESLGTLVLPASAPMKPRKRWLAHSAHCAGVLHVDEGAARALRERGKSLLLVGVTRCEGGFAVGDLVRIVDSAGKTVARGLTNYAADELRKRLAGGGDQHPLAAGPGYREVVHRNNMAIVSE